VFTEAALKSGNKNEGLRLAEIDRLLSSIMILSVGIPVFPYFKELNA